jgi:hypothetical protein
MTTYRVSMALVLSSCAMLASAAAHADIGAVGSPVKASNPNAVIPQPTPTAEDAVTTTIDTNDRTPIMVIRFNQNHVFFQRALRQAVEATNKAKPGAFFDVVSMVPVGGTMAQSERVNSSAADNLNSVVQEMQNLGVTSSQIHTSTESTPTATIQEIDIFVQ